MTSPFIKPELPRPATSCWLVHQVGEHVEVVHIGPTTPDVQIAIERMARIFGDKAIAIAGETPDGCIGFALEDSDQDAIWRSIIGHATDNTKVDHVRIYLGLGRARYIELARMAGIK